MTTGERLAPISTIGDDGMCQSLEIFDEKIWAFIVN
jgi:hypothetical protein